jgi:hypothetical protein
MENFIIQNKSTNKQINNAEQCLEALFIALSNGETEKAERLKESLKFIHVQIAKTSANETQENLTQMISSFNKQIESK